MATFLHRYFSLVLVLSLVVPLWLSVFTRSGPQRATALHTSLVWSGYTTCRLVGSPLHPPLPCTRCLAQSNSGRNRHFTFDCCWPCCFSISAPKHCFFAGIGRNKSRFSRILDFTQCFMQPSLKPFMFICCSISPIGFCSDHCFSASPIPLWTGSGLVRRPFALAGALALSFERLIFGGVHNSFYFAGPLMWLCPPCASPAFSSYAWTPADFFVHAAILPIIVLLMSYYPTTSRKI